MALAYFVKKLILAKEDTVTQTFQNSLKSTDHKQNLRNSPLVEVEKYIDAPIGQVFKAWSNPDLIKQWWGPEGFSCPEASIDFVDGGKYLFAMKENSSGNVMWSTGNYEQTLENEKIVCTDQFSDAEGHPIPAQEVGMAGDWPDILYVTVEFEDLGGNRTKISLSHEGIPETMHDDCVDGWSSSLEKLKKALETEQREQ